jgi:hypothetical protein
MKTYHLLTLLVTVGIFNACSKASSIVVNKPGGSGSSTDTSTTTGSKSTDTLTNLQASSLSFYFNGDTAYSTAFTTIDTGWGFTSGPAYPQLQLIGYVKIPALQDSLYFIVLLDDVTRDLYSINQFTGNWNDTSYEGHTSSFLLNSQVNDNAYSDVPSNEDFYLSITSNNGRTIKGAFYGVVATDPNNTGAPPTIPITKGVFSVNLY